MSSVINDFARWMMQDVGMGASTEQPGIQTEVPPLEMHHIGELLELFPEPAAITSYQRGLDLIADYLVDAETGQTRCCAPLTPGGWGLNYVDQETGFALGVVKGYQLTGDDAWLRQITPAVTRALDYSIDVETDPTTRLVKNSNPNAGEADYTNDY